MEACKLRVVRIEAKHDDELDNEINQFLRKEDKLEVIDIKPIDSKSALIICGLNSK